MERCWINGKFWMPAGTRVSYEVFERQIVIRPVGAVAASAGGVILNIKWMFVLEFETFGC